MLRPALLVLLLAGGPFACGGDDDPGSGTGTLRVIARGLTGAGSGTNFTVDITARGLAVLDAVVDVQDLDTGDSTTLLGRDGLYLGQLPGAVTRLELDIVAGDDNLRARIGGPESFEITRPADGDRVARSESGQLFVQWTRPEDETIDAVELLITEPSGEALERVSFDADPGEGRVTLPVTPGLFAAAVLRRDRVILAGGTEGSELSLERRRSIGFELVD